MEKDEAYVPKTRATLGIPADASESTIKEMLEDTPIFTLLMLIRQQLLAFDAYLCEYPRLQAAHLYVLLSDRP